MRVMSIVQSLRHPLELLQSLPRNQKKNNNTIRKPKESWKACTCKDTNGCVNCARIDICHFIYNNIFLHIGTVGLFLNPSWISSLCYKTDETTRDFGLVLKHVAFNISIYELFISTHPGTPSCESSHFKRHIKQPNDLYVVLLAKQK